MKRVTVILFVCLVACACATPEPKEKEFNFETDDVMVKRLEPNLIHVKTWGYKRRGSLLRIRRSYVNEIVRSANDF